MLPTVFVFTWKEIAPRWFHRLVIYRQKLLPTNHKLMHEIDKSFADDLVASRYCKHASSLCATSCWDFSCVPTICSPFFRNHSYCLLVDGCFAVVLKKLIWKLVPGDWSWGQSLGSFFSFYYLVSMPRHFPCRGISHRSHFGSRYSSGKWHHCLAFFTEFYPYFPGNFRRFFPTIFEVFFAYFLRIFCLFSAI